SVLSLRLPPPPSILFPYTTLFRSPRDCRNALLCQIDLSDQMVLGIGHIEHVPGQRATLWMMERRRVEITVAAADREPSDPKGRSDRKSTRLNSSHLGISYAVFCLK